MYERDFSAANFLEFLRKRGLTLVTAESCTGGLAAKLLTDVAGSSDVFWGAFVTYSNAAKIKCLGVSAELLKEYGAVSGQTARAMVDGALAVSGASAAIAVSGIAGPGGGSADKPVGTVWLGAGLSGGPRREVLRLFPGSRQNIRLAAVRAALVLLRDLVESSQR